jgi:hypothetical protein
VVIAMIIDAESPPLVAEPDEVAAFQLELAGFVHAVIEFHLKGHTIAEARQVLGELSRIFKEQAEAQR